MIKTNYFLLLAIFLSFSHFNVSAETMVDAYELIYDEQETGTDPYQVKITITDRYLRIDQLDDESGYVIYDDKKQLIHSVAHHDQTVLLIPKYKYKKPDLTKQVKVSYLVAKDAPAISGNVIYNYIATTTDKTKEKCLDIQLAEGLLTKQLSILVSYQKLLSGQQSRLLEATPEEYRTSCFLYDQVFNEGAYYEKGLPIQEWHSNGKHRLLVSYKKVKVDVAIFQSEKSYKQYSLD